MNEDDFLPLRRTFDCSRAPMSRSIAPLANTFLVVAEAGDVDSLAAEWEQEGRAVVRGYFNFPLLEVTASAEEAEELARDPRVTTIFPALGSLRSRRTLAQGFAAVAALADAQNHQVSAQPYGGRGVGDDIGYPILVPAGERFEVDFDPELDLPAPPALLPVVNFSVGPTSASHPVLTNDIVNVATLMASQSMLVVAAAGNCGGVGDDSMSAWARPPWVLSVGATSDEEGTTLADFSSRGDPGVEDSGPDLVAYGRSDVAPHPMGTSFAAPRVTALTRLVAAAMAQLGREIRVAGGADDHGVPLVGSAIIDDFDGELTESTVEYLPLTALPVLGVDRPSVARYVEAAQVVGVTDVRLTPAWLKSFLLSCATPMPNYSPHEVGRGFIDVERVVAGLCRVTFTDLENWFRPQGKARTAGATTGAHPFVDGELRLLDGILRRTGPSVRYDYKTQHIALVPALRAKD